MFIKTQYLLQCLEYAALKGELDGDYGEFASKLKVNRVESRNTSEIVGFILTVQQAN